MLEFTYECAGATAVGYIIDGTQYGPFPVSEFPFGQIFGIAGERCGSGITRTYELSIHDDDGRLADSNAVDVTYGDCPAAPQRFRQLQSVAVEIPS